MVLFIRAELIESNICYCFQKMSISIVLDIGSEMYVDRILILTGFNIIMASPPNPPIPKVTLPFKIILLYLWNKTSALERTSFCLSFQENYVNFFFSLLTYYLSSFSMILFEINCKATDIKSRKLLR